MVIEKAWLNIVFAQEICKKHGFAIWDICKFQVCTNPKIFAQIPSIFANIPTCPKNIVVKDPG